MAEIAYQDFDLSLEKAPAGFRATVRASPAGCASSDFVLPFDNVRIENFILRLGRVRRGVRRIESPEMQGAREFGGALFQAVFTGEVRACLRSSLDEMLRRGQGLRLRLRVNAPELWGLPWEYLYYPSRDQFLALSVHSPLVRYIELAEPVPVLAVDPPLRVLAMISSPADHPPLDVEREWRLLNEAVGTLHPTRRVILERLREPTLSALQRRLRRHDYHVFHFIGHGGYNQEKDEGVLLLEDENHKGDIVSSRHLGTLLHDHRPLRVAVLNACEGARSSLVDPFAGSAQTLVQQGLPAVIAMQFEIGDDVATTFAQELYGALSDGYPIDAAVTESRKAIFTSGHEVAWGTPVLYMRTPDGRIFDVRGTGHPVPGLGAAAEERERPRVKGAGAGGALGFVAPPALAGGGEWGLGSSDPEAPLESPHAVEAADGVFPPREEPAHEQQAAERKRLSEAQTREPEPFESVASMLDRAREHAAQGRHGEALHLVGLALAHEPGSIEARVLKRQLLHTMGTAPGARPRRARITAALHVIARPAAGVLAIVILAVLAFALARWRAPKPAETTARQQQQRRQEPPRVDTKPEQTLAQAETAAEPEPKANNKPSVGVGGGASRPIGRRAATPAQTPATPPATRPASPAQQTSASTVAPKGTLVLDVPPGTEVVIDGEAAGRAPLAAVEVAAGAHEVTLRHPTFGNLRRTVSAPAGSPTRVSVSEATMREAHAGTQERLARRALSEGSRERALAIASAALTVAPAHAGLRDFLATFARDAMNEAIAARKAAERAGRAARRSSAFALGDSSFERAEHSHNANRLTEAIRAYWAARAQYERAVRDTQ